MDVDAVNSLSRLAKEKGHRVRVIGVFSLSGAHFQRDCTARKSTSKQSSGKGKQIKSKNEGNGKSEESNGKAKRKSEGNKGAKGSHMGKTSKTLEF